MILTKEQQLKVEENLGLVGKVIKDKVHCVGQLGIYTYDDIYQIGCLGLSKAAATDKGGCFSTYAYRLIWNEICDALIYASKQREAIPIEEVVTLQDSDVHDIALQVDMQMILEKAKAGASETVRKGIDAIVLFSQGYSCREIGELMGAEANLVSAWISKARKYLKEMSEMKSYICGG